MTGMPIAFGIFHASGGKNHMNCIAVQLGFLYIRAKGNFFFDFLSLLGVNIQLDSVLTNLGDVVFAFPLI